MASSSRAARGAWSVWEATLRGKSSRWRPGYPSTSSLSNPPRAVPYSDRYASTIVGSAPRIAQPSFWKSLIPKPLRGQSSSPSTPPPIKPQQRKEWNPFVVYMIIFMLIGSNAINMIGIRNDLLSFSQKTDRQIASLKEVIRKIQNGEKVDIEAALGTGDPEREKEWEEALKEIESTDTLYNNELRKRQQKAEQEQKATSKANASTGEASKKSTGFY